MDEQAFEFEGAVIALDTGIEIRSMGTAHDHPNAQTPEKASEGGGEIAPTGCSDPARIAIEGDRARPALLAQDAGYCLQCRLRMKIGMHL